MDAISTFVPEVRLNKDHISIIFRIPYWLFATLLLVFVIVKWQGKHFDVLLITSCSTWVFWILNRYWPYKKADGGIYVRQWN